MATDSADGTNLYGFALHTDHIYGKYDSYAERSICRGSKA